MDRIQHPTATGSHQFTEGDPGSGTAATVVTAQFLNNVQEELVGAIEAAGLTPSVSVVNQLRRAIFELSYPVGSYYWTRRTDLTASQILGFGTWVQLPPGCVPVTLNVSETEFNVIGKTGGAKTHQLTAAQLPIHNHQPANTSVGTDYGFIPTSITGQDVTPSNFDTNASGGEPNVRNQPIAPVSVGANTPHNNLQPYVVIGLGWYRTA